MVGEVSRCGLWWRAVTVLATYWRSLALLPKAYQALVQFDTGPPEITGYIGRAQGVVEAAPRRDVVRGVAVLGGDAREQRPVAGLA